MQLLKNNFYGYLVICLLVILFFSGCTDLNGNTSKQSFTTQRTSTIVTVGTSISTLPQKVDVTTNVSGSINQTTSEIVMESEKAENLTQIEDLIESMYRNLYIGELCKSGYVYIEPFSVNREASNEKIVFKEYPNNISFQSIDDNKIYPAIFDSESDVYIPNKEEDSKYFWQGVSQPNQYVLRYKAGSIPDEATIGITLLNYEIESIDFGIKGHKRAYSESEKEKALNEVKADNDAKDSDPSSGLRKLTLDDTVVGAQQICCFSIKGEDIKILLSKYLHIGFESTADMYVIDLIKNGEVIRTFDKYNGVTY